MRGQYHWSCRERHKRLEKLAADGNLGNFDSVLFLHEQGVEFKLHPIRSTRRPEEFHAELEFLMDIGRQLWLHLESKHLGRNFPSVESYGFDRAPKCPETSPLKNRLINLRTFGFHGLLDE